MMKRHLYILIIALLAGLSLSGEAQSPEDSISEIRFGETRRHILSASGMPTDSTIWTLADISQGDIPIIRVARILGQLSPRLGLYNGRGELLLESQGNVFGDADELIFEDGLDLSEAPYFIEVIADNIINIPDHPGEYALTIIKDGTRRTRPDEGLDNALPLVGQDSPPALVISEQPINSLNISVLGEAVSFENVSATRASLRSGEQELTIDRTIALSSIITNVNFIETGIGLSIQNANLSDNPDRRFFSDENFTLIFNEISREYTFTMSSGMTIVTPFAQIDSIEVRDGFAAFLITVNGEQKRLVFNNQVINVRRSGTEAINYTIQLDGNTITSDLALWDTLASYSDPDSGQNQIQLYAGDNSRFISEITNLNITGDTTTNVQTISFLAPQLNSQITASVTLAIDWYRISEILIDVENITALTRNNILPVREAINNIESVLIHNGAIRFARRDDTFRTVYPDGTDILTPSVLTENSDILPYQLGFRTRNYNNLGADILPSCACSQAIQSHTPVNPTNGNFYYSVNDFSVRGQSLALNLSRYYNSHDNRLTAGSRLTPRYILNSPVFYPHFGNGWRHNYQYELDISTEPLGRITFIEPDGTGHYFFRDENESQWISATLLSTTIFRNEGTLGTWRAETSDGRYYYYDRVGRLTRINEISQSIVITPAPLAYTTTESLDGIFVVGEYGRRIELYADEMSNITRATSTTRSKINYVYDENGSLETVDYGTVLENTVYDYSELGLLTDFDDARSPYTPIGHVDYDPERRVEMYTENPNSDGELQRQYTFLYNLTDEETGSRSTNRVFEVNGERRVHTWTYNSRWQLIRVELPRDDWDYEFEYDANSGILERVRIPTGVFFNLEFDERGNLSGFSDPLGERSYSFSYETRGTRSLLTQIRNPNNQTETFTWSGGDNPQLLEQETLVNVNSTGRVTRLTRFRYDDNGRIHMIIDPGNVATVYVYDFFGYVSEIREGIQLVESEIDSPLANIEANRASRIIQFRYDPIGQLITMTILVDGRELSYRLSWAGEHISSVTAPGGATIRYQYNSRGLVEWIDTTPRNSITSVTENSRGESVLSIAQAEEQKTFYIYNNLDLMTSIIDPTSAIQTFNYDEAGNLIESINDRQVTTSYTYDALNNLVSQRSGTGLITRYTTDLDATANAIISSETDASGRIITGRYNFLGQLNRYTISNENSTPPYFQEFSLTYTDIGNLNQVEDTQIGQHRLDLDYNLLGEITSIDVSGAETLFAYNNSGLLSQVRSPAGRLFSYAYDPAGNISHVTMPDETLWQYAYDANNNLNSATNPLQLTTQYIVNDLNQLERILYPEGHEEQFTYDDRGNLASTVDAGQFRTTYTYDSLDRLAIITAMGNSADENANPIEYQYIHDSSGRLIRAIPPDSDPIQLVYDNDDNIIAITDQQLYSYDIQGRVASVTDNAGHTTSYAYNPLGLVIRIQDALGNLEEFTWRSGTNFLESYTSHSGQRYEIDTDSIGRITGIRLLPDGNNSEPINTQIFYDEDGYIEGIQLGTLNARTSGTNDRFYQFRYSPNGNPERYIDPLEQEWSLLYDDIGRLIQLSNPDNVLTRYAYDGLDLNVTNYVDEDVQFNELFRYDGNGNIITYEIPGLIRNQYNYNSLNLLNRASLALDETGVAGAEYTFEYNPSGRIIGITEPGGRVSSYDYPADAPDNLTTYTIRGVDGTDLRSSYVYDNIDNLSEITLPDNDEDINLSYDALNRRVRYVDSEDNSWAYSYDASGNLSQISDPLGSAISYFYDQYNRVAQISYPSGKIVDLEYDTAGNLDAVILPPNVNDTRQRIEYELDELGRVTSVQVGANFLGFAYDTAGNVTRRFAADDTTTTYEYDAAGRLTSTSYSNSDETIVYSYDAMGNLESVGELTFTRDIFGRITRAADNNGLIEYQYDNAGNLETRNTTGVLSETTAYIYDDLYRVEQIDYAGQVVTINYDESGRISQIKRGDNLTTRRLYDENNRIESIIHTNENNNRIIFLYIYDNAGNLVKVEVSGDGNDTEVSYSYDIDQRLISERWLSAGNETAYVVNYRYDAVGNRIEESRNGRVSTFNYNRQNQLIREQRNVSVNGSEFMMLPSLVLGLAGLVFIGRRRKWWIIIPISTGLFVGIVFAQSSSEITVEYTYDFNGNVESINYIRDESYTLNYGYDNENRLIAVEGQIISIDEDNDEIGVAINTGYTYDALSRVIEIRTLEADYELFYDGRTLIAMSDGNSIERYLNFNGETLMTITGEEEILWNINDRQSSTRRYTEVNGDFIDDTSRILEFGSFGSRIFPGGDHVAPIGASIEQPVQFFAGQLYDPSTQLYLMGLRAYDPIAGRFLQPDPVRHDPSGTLYTYARNRPLVFQDPTGMFVEPFTQALNIPVVGNQINPESFVPRPDFNPIPLPPSVHGLQADETFRAVQLQQATQFGVNTGLLQISPFNNEIYLFDINPIPPEMRAFADDSLEQMMRVYEAGEGWIPDPRPDPTVSQNPFELLDEMMPTIARAYTRPFVFNGGSELELSLLPEISLPQAFSSRDMIEHALIQLLQPIQAMIAIDSESDYLMGLVPRDIAPAVTIPTVTLPETLIEPPVLDNLDALREQTFDFYSRIWSIGTEDCIDCVPPLGFNQ